MENNSKLEYSDIGLHTRVRVLRQQAEGFVEKILSDGTLLIRFDDDDQGHYMLHEVEIAP